MANEVEEQEVVSERSLDEGLTETIRSTLKDITSRDAEKAAAVDTPSSETAPVETKTERVRDEEGKFAKAPKVRAQKEPAAPAEQLDKKPPTGGAVEQVAAGAEPKDVPLTTTSGQPIDLNRPPSAWKPAAKAAWNALPEPVRAEIYRREGDYHVGLKDIKSNADFGQSIKATVEPYRMLIEAEGGTPERAIADTLRTAALFRVGTPQQKLQALFELDNRFGAGLNAHFQNEVAKAVAQATGQPQPQRQQQQVFQDPRVDQLLAAQQRQEQERVQREQSAAGQATERFLATKDDKGQPLYPFVDNVLDDMSERVTAIRRRNPAASLEDALKQAYEAAVWANPETRAVLQSQQQAQANQPAENLRKLDAAKRASAVNVPKRGSLPASTPTARFGTAEADEQMRETLRQLQS